MPKSGFVVTLFIFFAGEDRRVRVWDLRNGGLMKEFRGHTDTVYSLSFNQDNSVLATGILFLFSTFLVIISSKETKCETIIF